MKKILKNLKWILLPISIILLLWFVEASTDEYGISSSEEGMMYLTWCVVIVNACLFVFNKKWIKLIDDKF